MYNKLLKCLLLIWPYDNDTFFLEIWDFENKNIPKCSLKLGYVVPFINSSVQAYLSTAEAQVTAQKNKYLSFGKVSNFGMIDTVFKILVKDRFVSSAN